MAEYCDDGRFAVYRTYWENQDQYQAIAGKTLGIMDEDTSPLQVDLNQYGVVAVFAHISALDAAKSIGFSATNIIIRLVGTDWDVDVDQAIGKGVTHFYVDEPIHAGLQNMVLDAAPYIANRGGILSISEQEFDWWKLQVGWGAISDMANLAEAAQPHSFVGCHTHFDHQQLGTVDPRDQWTYLRNRVPSLFDSAWIKTRQSGEEIDLLFGHANNIGISKLHYYPFDLDGGTYLGRIEIASDRGWRQGWLKRLQKERIDRWCCPTQLFDPEACDFHSFQYTGQERWV